MSLELRAATSSLSSGCCSGLGDPSTLAGVMDLLRGSGKVVMSKSCSDIPAYRRFWGGVARTGDSSSAMFDVWVLDLGLVAIVAIERELEEESVAMVDCDRRRVAAGRGAEFGPGLGVGLWWYCDHPEATLMKLRHFVKLVGCTSMPCDVDVQRQLRDK